MSRPHRIRLQAEWTAAASGAVWTRSFGRPTGIDAGDRVWLVIERPVAHAAAINGRPLPAFAGGVAWRHDITADLRGRNELQLAFAVPATTAAEPTRVPLPEALGVVSLEIETGA